jgi:hypothetical protein
MEVQLVLLIVVTSFVEIERKLGTIIVILVAFNQSNVSTAG